MNKKIRTACIIGISSAAVLGIGLWRFRVANTFAPTHRVIVRDRSDSVTTGCDCTGALVKRALQGPNMKAGSTVTVTLTGDDATANEPVSLSSIEVPATRRVLEGRDAAITKQNQLLADIKTQCEKAPITKRSPIALAIGRAVEHLRALGCGAGSDCAVDVQTDLEENGDPHVKAAFDRSTKIALPVLMNNNGIAVTFFGTAETTGIVDTPTGGRRLSTPRNPQRADRMVATWRSLFSSPDLVRFEPYCPRN